MDDEDDKLARKLAELMAGKPKEELTPLDEDMWLRFAKEKLQRHPVFRAFMRRRPDATHEELKAQLDSLQPAHATPEEDALLLAAINHGLQFGSGKPPR